VAALRSLTTALYTFQSATRPGVTSVARARDVAVLL